MLAKLLSVLFLQSGTILFWLISPMFIVTLSITVFYIVYDLLSHLHRHWE